MHYVCLQMSYFLSTFFTLLYLFCRQGSECLLMICFVLSAAFMFHHYPYAKLDVELRVPLHPVLVGKLSTNCLQRFALQRMEMLLIEMEMIFYFSCLKGLIMTFFIVENGMLQICLCRQFKTLCPHLRFHIFRWFRQNYGESDLTRLIWLRQRITCHAELT